MLSGSEVIITKDDKDLRIISLQCLLQVIEHKTFACRNIEKFWLAHHENFEEKCYSLKVREFYHFYQQLIAKRSSKFGMSKVQNKIPWGFTGLHYSMEFWEGGMAEYTIFVIIIIIIIIIINIIICYYIIIGCVNYLLYILE